MNSLSFIIILIKIIITLNNNKRHKFNIVNYLRNINKYKLLAKKII